MDVENALDLADSIGDADTAKKEKMALAKQLDSQLAKTKFASGEQV